MKPFLKPFGFALIFVSAIACGASLLELHAVSRIIPASWSDLYPQWIATGAALHGKNPYSHGVTETIQCGFYGHVLQPGEDWDQQSFVYPAHLVLLLAPFTPLPWPLVRLIFTVVAPPLVALTLWLWFRICGVNLGRVATAILYVLTLTSWPAVWAYQQQQPTVWIAAMLALAVFLFQRESDIPAAILLALATVKPTLVVPLLAWLLLLATFQKRWRFCVTFGVSSFVLLASSEAIVHDWISRWLEATHVYALDPHHVTALAHLLGPRLGMTATLLLAAALSVRLWQLRPGTTRPGGFGKAVALLLAFTLCVLPTTSWMIYNQILLIPAVLVLAVAPPQPGAGRFFRSLALASLGWALASVPLCTGLMLLIGYRPVLTVLPFLTLWLPPVMLLGLLVQRQHPARAMCGDQHRTWYAAWNTSFEAKTTGSSFAAPKRMDPGELVMEPYMESHYDLACADVDAGLIARRNRDHAD